MKLRDLVPNSYIHISVSELQGASKIKLKKVNEKMKTERLQLEG